MLIRIYLHFVFGLSIITSIYDSSVSTLPQNALRRDCNGKCIEIIEGHYLEVVVLLYMYIHS